MNISELYDPAQAITKIREQETSVRDLEARLSAAKFTLQELIRINTENTNIPLKESAVWCLTVDSENPSYFLKTPVFVSKCIAYKHGVELTRDIKNKIASTLSLMYSQGEVGRIAINGKNYYGLAKFFKAGNMTELKNEFKPWTEDLRQ